LINISLYRRRCSPAIAGFKPFAPPVGPLLVATSLLLAACSAAPADMAPDARAWPLEPPLATLVERGPWSLSDLPAVLLYADGTVLFVPPNGVSPLLPELRVSRLSPAGLASARRALGPTPDFLALRDRYDLLPRVTDMPTTEIAIRSGAAVKRVSIHGFSPEHQLPADLFARVAGDRLPAELARLVDVLVSFRGYRSEVWQPRFLEVRLWPFPEAELPPIEWPAGWPVALSRTSGGSSVVLPGENLSRLADLLTRRADRQAILIGGRKWGAAYRPVMPGSELAASASAAR